MRILSIGMFIEHELVDEVEFRSETSALDYDILLWDPNRILDGYDTHTSETYMGHPALDSDSSIRILEDIVRRKAEIDDLLRLGRSVIICTPSPDKFYVDTGARDYSGTGRNRQIIRKVKQFDLL